MPTAHLLLAAATAFLPLAASAQQPRRDWETVSQSWALTVDSGAPIPCRKTGGGWPENRYPPIKSPSDKHGSPAKTDFGPTTFRCGAITLRHQIDQSSPGWSSGLRPPTVWVVTDKTGKNWRAYVPDHLEHGNLDPLGGEVIRWATVLEINGKQIQLIETVRGRFVPLPQPIFR